MKSGMLLNASALLALSTLLAGCVTTAISNDVPDCPSLVPASLLEPVDGVDPEPRTLPDGHEDVQPWREAWLGTQFALEKSNSRPEAVQHINKTCLDLHRKALKKSGRGFLGRLFD